MKYLYRTLLLSFLFFFLSAFIGLRGIGGTEKKAVTLNKRVLLYDNVWGSIYHAEKRQCDNTPLLTGSQFRINPNKASDHRIIAISQEMLDSPFRVKLLNNPESELYNGKIRYGDTVWVDSPSEEINGWWIVHDTKNQRYRKSIDFLQTKGDGSLYRNNPYWSGKFEDIKIYKHIKTIYN